MAKLYFKHSPMNAGKTTILLQTAHNYERDGHNIALVKSSIDTKGDDTVVSRIGISRKVDILADPKADIRKLVHKLNKHNIVCVIVDEAQFLTPKQVMQLRMLVDEDHIPVMAFGLRSDFQRKAFPGSMALFELADIIDEIRTVCRCMKKASFNARLINGKMVFEGSQVAIDGEGDITYIPLCGACYRAEELKAKG